MDPFEDFASAGPSRESPNLYNTEHATHTDTYTSNAETRRIVRTRHVHNAASQQEQAVQTCDKIRVIHTGSGKIRIERAATFHHRQKEGAKIEVDFSKSLSSGFQLDLEDFRNPIPTQTPLLHVPRPAIKVEEDFIDENEVNSLLPHFKPSASPPPQSSSAHQHGFDQYIQHSRPSYDDSGPSNLSSLPLRPLPAPHHARRVASPQVLNGHGYDENDEYRMSGGAGSRSVHSGRSGLGRRSG